MTYEEWLEKTQTELREAIEEAEEGGWHHLTAPDDADPRYSVFARLLTWEAEVTRRRDWYAQAKRRPQKGHKVDRLQDF